MFPLPFGSFAFSYVRSMCFYFSHWKTKVELSQIFWFCQTDLSWQFAIIVKGLVECFEVTLMPHGAILIFKGEQGMIKKEHSLVIF